jgi:hypothetical protein
MGEEVARVLQSLGGVPRRRTNDGVVSLIEHVSCTNDRKKLVEHRGAALRASSIHRDGLPLL